MKTSNTSQGQESEDYGNIMPEDKEEKSRAISLWEGEWLAADDHKICKDGWPQNAQIYNSSNAYKCWTKEAY